MRAYPHLDEPEEHPEFANRWARATTRAALENKVQFATLRRFTERDNKLIDVEEKLDLYTKEIEMGKVIWPFVCTLTADNFEEFVEEIERRKLFVFDFWGYVPGTNPAGQGWGQYRVQPRALDVLEQRLGERFLGTDNGEQDGRYIGSYAHMLYPDSTDRRRQLINFRDYFDKVADDMGHVLTVLCSLNYCHYFAAMGDHIMLGAETAQALPNSNLWYAYLRGAGKQHGLLWFGNASVWNRFGWKSYSSSGGEGTYDEHGPECGTSLSLLRRLLYTHYAYNCDILGFESGWFYAESLEGDKEGKETSRPTPIGEIQHGCVRFVKEHPRPGVLLTPTAIMLDYYNGWTFPRHLYSDSVYKTWGNLPYEPGDYQIHAIYTMIYPGYENAGFYHDERGFLTPTPYGDAFDVLFNDARAEILNRYSLLVLAGSQRIDCETEDKLRAFAEGGGQIVLWASHLQGMSDFGWLGLRDVRRQLAHERAVINYAGVSYQIENVELTELIVNTEVEILAVADDAPFIVRASVGQGTVTVIGSPYGLQELVAVEPDAMVNEPDKEIGCPFDLLPPVKAYLRDLFKEQKLIDVANDLLQYTTGWLGETQLLVSVCNNGLYREEFELSSPVGEIVSCEEWELPPCPDDTLGYFPSVSRDVAVQNTAPREEGIVAAGDIRFYSVELASASYRGLAKQEIRDRSKGRLLSLWNVTNLREELLVRERLRQHFDGIKIEARYLLERDTENLRGEASFFKRQRLDAVVDFIGLLNFYPGLTLISNIESRQQQSIQTIRSIFEKMARFGMRRALFALHRNAENNYTFDQARQSFLNSFTEIADDAAEHDVSLCITTRPLMTRTMLWDLKPPGVRAAETVGFIRAIGKPNVSFCLDTTHLLMAGENPVDVLETYGDVTSLLALGTPGVDSYGQYYNMHRPIRHSQWEEELRTLIRKAQSMDPTLPVCLNSVYKDWDEVYADSCLLAEAPTGTGDTL